MGLRRTGKREKAFLARVPLLWLEWTQKHETVLSSSSSWSFDPLVSCFFMPGRRSQLVNDNLTAMTNSNAFPSGHDRPVTFTRPQTCLEDRAAIFPFLFLIRAEWRTRCVTITSSDIVVAGFTLRGIQCTSDYDDELRRRVNNLRTCTRTPLWLEMSPKPCQSLSISTLKLIAPALQASA